MLSTGLGNGDKVVNQIDKIPHLLEFFPRGEK